MDASDKPAVAARVREHDSRLTMRLAAGDARAMAEFYDRWVTSVLAVVRLVLAVDAVDGEDEAPDAHSLTQATFVELWRTAPAQTSDGSTCVWTLATAQRVTRAR